MKLSHLLPLFLLCSNISVNGQFHAIVFETESKICPLNNERYQGFKNWELYQTEDGFQTGERIPICPEISGFLSRPNITSTTHEALKPLYLHGTGLDLGVNTTLSYAIDLFISDIDADICNCNASCNIDDCLSVKLIIRGTFEDIWIRDTITIDNFFASGSGFQFINCFLTGKYEEQFVDEIIVKVIPNSDQDSLDFGLGNFFISEFGEFDEPFNNNLVTNENKQFGAYIVEPNYFTSNSLEDFVDVLVLHDIDGLPSTDNKHVYEIIPEDSLSQQNINILQSEFNKLLFQRYTQIRGAVVQGKPMTL